MLATILPSTIAGQGVTVIAFLVALAVVCILYRRLRSQNRRLADALDNMSQGLCMFDAQGRIVVRNQRYIDMYKLSEKIVHPGCTLKRLMQHRKETGLFTGDVDQYC